MKTLELTNYKGLDYRQNPDVASPLSWADAVNVHLTTTGGAASRDQLRLFAKVDPGTVGLYVVDDKLRTALPYPALTGPVPREPLGVAYDLLVRADGQAFDETVLEVSSVTAWDNVPYLAVKLDTAGGVRYEHHYAPGASKVGYIAYNIDPVLNTVDIDGLDSDIAAGATVRFLTAAATTDLQVLSVTPGSPTSTLTLDGTPPSSKAQYPVVIYWPQSTKVNVPFEPGPAVITTAAKVWAVDRVARDVWFSSTQNGPTDWTAVDDAGFLSTSRYVTGDQPIRGFGTFQSQLAVFYERFVQLWRVDPDPANHVLVDAVGGAGTLYPWTVANVMGDLVYFGYGGFRALSAAAVTGQTKEGDVGAEVQPATKRINLNALSYSPVALWSAWRSQYLCVIGQDVWVYTLSPVGQVRGWGKWSLPFEVEAMVEWRNTLFLRRAGTGEVWAFDPDYQDEAGYEWSVRFHQSDCEAANYLKHLKLMLVKQDGASTVSFYFDPYDLTNKQEMFTLDGTTTNAGKVSVNSVAEMVGAGFTGKGAWQLDSFSFRFDIGNIL